MHKKERKHPIRVTPHLHWEAPIRRLSEGVEIALIDFTGNPSLTEAVGKELACRIRAEVDTLLMPEGKAAPLLHVVQRTLSNMHLRQNGFEAVIVRKAVRSYMRAPIVTSRESSSLTSSSRIFVLDADDVAKLAGRKVAIIDDVVSTGETVKVLHEMIEHCGGSVAGVYAVATEGDTPMPGVNALTHLPSTF